MRDSIIFYRSFYEAINELPLNVQAKVYSAIFEYSLNFNEVELSGLPKTIFTLIKPQLDANNKRFENGSKGGRKKTETKPKRNQNETKTEANNNVNDNNNDNVNNNHNHFDEASEIFSDETDDAKNFLKTEKKIQMDRLRMKHHLSPENLNAKIDEFIDKKTDWGETGWKDNYEMAKNFELWLNTNHKIIINPFKTMTEKEFHADVGKFEKEFGKKMLTDFYRYWNQPTETGEMRFQEKNAWNTENQLKIWKSRNGK